MIYQTIVRNTCTVNHMDVPDWQVDIGVLAGIIVDCNYHLLFCGDLNCASSNGSTVDDRLATVLSQFGLVQHATELTRLLDIIAADNHVPIRNVHMIDSAGISDHCLITATVPIQLSSLTKIHHNKTTRVNSVF